MKAEDLRNLQMFEVPKSSRITMGKSDYIEGTKNFDKDLFQIVVGNHGVIYNVENINQVYEVTFLETLN